MTDAAAEFDIVVIGAGPAGLAAAWAAAGGNRRVALLDETPWLGGQIWRGQQAAGPVGLAAQWLGRFLQSGATLLDRTCVIAAPEPGLLLAERDSEPCQIRWKRLILATGARELLLPFPGWTLPGVTGAGGILNLVKNGWPVQGQRVVIAGSGPLLLAAAEGLAKHGARVVGIFEQTTRSALFGFVLGLCGHPEKVWQALRLRLGLLGVPYRLGTWPVRAEGSEQIKSVTLTNGRRTWTQPCDLLACGFGLVPNVELALGLDCALQDGFVRVDGWQATSQPNIFCAGEPTGIAGADSAIVQGQIAGYAASEQRGRAEALGAQRDSWRRFGQSLAKAFALRPELKSIATEDTLVCRCEDVSLGRLRQCTSWREAKLHARCGMGPCQGRVCGPAAQCILGWGMESMRPPVSPAKVQSLISGVEALKR